LNGGAVGRIVGVGRALGGRIVTNSDLEGVLDTTDEWISTRTGIKARHFVAEGENAATLAVEASKRALRHAGVDGGSVDLIISTAVLFGDGAGAVVLDGGEGDSGFVDHILGADGRGAPLGRAGHPGDDEKLFQNGREVFKFAVRILPDMVEKLLSRNGLSPDEVQYLIPHQANARIIRSAARKMEVPEDRVVINLDRFGNTSAASIPLSYPDIYGAMEPGKYVITVGFGFGLTWAANLYRI
jgi:3-oxoacyl-[acyl-carrier-protein] synthase III